MRARLRPTTNRARRCWPSSRQIRVHFTLSIRPFRQPAQQTWRLTKNGRRAGFQSIKTGPTQYGDFLTNRASASARISRRRIRCASAFGVPHCHRLGKDSGGLPATLPKHDSPSNNRLAGHGNCAQHGVPKSSTRSLAAQRPATFAHRAGLNQNNLPTLFAPTPKQGRPHHTPPTS